MRDVAPAEDDPAAGRVEQAHDAPGHRGLAAARFAHHADRLASRTVKETPSTAFTDATCFWKMIPRVTGKYFWRSSTTRSSSPVYRPSVGAADVIAAYDASAIVPALSFMTSRSFVLSSR